MFQKKLVWLFLMKFITSMIPDRGHVWEKSIMFLPKNVPYLGLSATINKPEKLCEWNENQVFGAKRSEMYLCISNFRNVPLFHYSFLTMPQSQLNASE